MANAALYEQLLKDRIVFLGGHIDDDVANDVIGRLLFLESEDPDRDAYLHIDSPGGSVTATLAIFDTIRYVKMSVSTLCIGQAAAAAALLLTAGAKDKRFAFPHARISLLPLYGGPAQLHVDLAVQAREIQRMTIAFHERFAACTGRSIAEVAEAMNRETYFSASEAKEFGLIDGIVLRRPLPGGDGGRTRGS